MKETVVNIGELLPPPGDENVGRRLFGYMAASIGYKRDILGLHDKLRKSYELAVNKHWKNQSRKKSLLTGNLIHRHRTHKVALLTDNHPRFDVRKAGGAEEDNEDGVRKIHRTAVHWYQEEEIHSIFRRAVKQCEDDGFVCLKMLFSSKDDDDDGEVRPIIVSGFQIGFWPLQCQEPMRDAEAWFHFYPESVRNLRRQYPDVADRIRGDSQYLDDVGLERATLNAIADKSGGSESTLQRINGVVKDFINTFRGAETDEGDSDYVLVCDGWVRDYTRVPAVNEYGEPVTDPLGTPVMEYKYPGCIRNVIATNGGSVVLADRPNPSINPDVLNQVGADTVKHSYLYRNFPFIFVNSSTDTVHAWGRSDIEQVADLLADFDKTLSQLATFKDRAVRLKWINPEGSGVPDEHFNNQMTVLRPNRHSAELLGHLTPPPYPADVHSWLTTIKDLAFEILGTFDLSQATDMNRDLAYKAVAALLERANTMLNENIENYDILLRAIGRMAVSLMQNWYTETRYITYEEDGEKGMDGVLGKDLLIPAKITVVSGSTMPRSRIQERDEAIELWRLQAIDAEELLRKLDWDNRRSVLRRMREGPMGEVFARLHDLGAPEPVVDWIRTVASADDTELARAMKDGTAPRFEDVLQANTPPEPDPIATAEAEKKRWEAELMREKVITERVAQEVKKLGTQYDGEMLNLKKTEIDIEKIRTAAELKHKAAVIRTGAATTTRMPGYQERDGLQSNNDKQ